MLSGLDVYRAAIVNLSFCRAWRPVASSGFLAVACTVLPLTRSCLVNCKCMYYKDTSYLRSDIKNQVDTWLHLARSGSGKEMPGLI